MSACADNLLRSPAEPTEDLKTQLEQIEVIASTPAVSEWVRNSLIQFQEETGRTDFRLEFISPGEGVQAAQDQSVHLLVIGSQPPADWFATPIGADAVVVILNPENPIRNLDPTALADIFSGRLQNWNALGDGDGFIQPIIPMAGDEIREYFKQKLLPDKSFYLGSLLAPTPKAMLSMVAEDVNAIGFAPLHTLNSEVKPIAIQSIKPSQGNISDGSYPLVFPIVATTPEEPSGSLRVWLEWLQSNPEQ